MLSVKTGRTMLRRLVISGGGTGGHIFPAIAIADAVKDKDPSVEILFVGAEGKMEMERVPAAGYRIVGLPIAGIQRRLSLENLRLPFRLFRSMKKAAAVLREFAPDAVVGVGGYASGPVLWQAARRGIPTVIQEQNSFAGLTNRWLGKRVDKICVAYKGMDAFFPEGKILFTGNPVRKDLRDIDRLKDEAMRHYRLRAELPTLLVFGGSLGARVLNEEMRQSLPLFGAARGVQLIWQTGRAQYDAYRERLGALPEGVVLLPFLERMDLAYAAADLVVCRAGALTLSELAVVGRPAILVPSPYVTADHQTHNARAFEKVGAAVMVAESEAPGTLAQTALELLRDEQRLDFLREKMTGQASSTAAQMIADLLFQMAEKN